MPSRPKNSQPVAVSTNRTPRRRKRRGRPAKKTSTGALRLANRRGEALALRLAGHSFAAIAKLMHCGTATAFAYVGAALAAVPVADLEEIRKLEGMRLDAMSVAIGKAALAGDMRAVDGSLRIMERRARLLGLDAPARAQVEASVSRSIEFIISADDAKL